VRPWSTAPKPMPADRPVSGAHLDPPPRATPSPRHAATRGTRARGMAPESDRLGTLKRTPRRGGPASRHRLRGSYGDSEAHGGGGQAQGRPAARHGQLDLRDRRQAAGHAPRGVCAEPARPRADPGHRRLRGAPASGGLPGGHRRRHPGALRPHPPRRRRRGRRRGAGPARAHALPALGGPRPPRRRGRGGRHRDLGGARRGRGRGRARRLGTAAGGDRRLRGDGRRRSPALRRRAPQRRTPEPDQGGRPRRRLQAGQARGDAADDQPAALRCPPRDARGRGRSRPRHGRPRRVGDPPGAPQPAQRSGDGPGPPPEHGPRHRPRGRRRLRGEVRHLRRGRDAGRAGAPLPHPAPLDRDAGGAHAGDHARARAGH